MSARENAPQARGGSVGETELHQARRVRPLGAALAMAATVAVTWLMWSDRPAESGLSDDIPLLPSAIEDPAQDLRSGWGDADAHVLLWLATAALVAWAVPGRRDRRLAFGALAVWSVVVEVLQPVVTTLRNARLPDAVAGLVGIAIVAVVTEMWAARRTT